MHCCTTLPRGHDMTITSRALGILGTFTLGASLMAFAGPAAEAAVTCPTVNSVTGAVSPAPAPDVDWLGCDLTGANLTGADLAGADLEAVNFTSANLTNANLTSANLSGLQLSNTNFTGATLTGVQSGSILTNGGGPVTLPANWNLFDGYLMGPGADLAGALLDYLNNTPIGAVDLEGANLSGANLYRSVLIGTDLTNANLTGADFDTATLENVNVSGARFAGADFFQLSMYTYSLDYITPVTGQAASLPKNWIQVGTYFLGPTVQAAFADLDNLNLTGADLWAANMPNATLSDTNLTGATLYGALVPGSVSATWSGTVCPDGTNSNTDSDTCDSNLTAAPVAFPTIVGANVTFGSTGWYASDPQVTWNWTDLYDAGIEAAHCPAKSTGTGQGTAVKITASCTNSAGAVAKQSVTVSVDTGTPKVTVTGVRTGQVYALGRVPAAGCKATDSLSGIGTRATVKITPTSPKAPGTYKATCTGAVTGAGLPQASPVSVTFHAAYGFSGFKTPKPGAKISHKARVLHVDFRLTGVNGKPPAAKVAAALARAHQVTA